MVNLRAISYGSCSSLRLRQLVRVFVPALVGLAGVVLVAASPVGPCVAVGLVAAGPGNDGAAELSEQLGNGGGDQLEAWTEAAETRPRYFALNGTDHASHKGQASMIRRYIIWRNNHAYDERLRRIVDKANVA